MNLRRILPLLLLLLFVAASKKEPPVLVRFFTEANPKDTETFAVPVLLANPPRQAWVSRVPAISEQDIQAVYPFRAADGSFGCAFRLDAHGTLALDTLSVEKRGQSLVATVNGRQVIDMLIDRRVTDGILTIQRGLTEQEVALLQKKWRTIGQPAKPRKR